jgi:hypothetical protein
MFTPGLMCNRGGIAVRWQPGILVDNSRRINTLHTTGITGPLLCVVYIAVGTGSKNSQRNKINPFHIVIGF